MKISNFILLAGAAAALYYVLKKKQPGKQAQDLAQPEEQPAAAPDNAPEQLAVQTEPQVQINPDSVRMTEREKEIFALMLQGKKRKEIASELYVSESTVKKYSTEIYKKFGVENRVELISKIFHGDNAE